MNENEYCLVSKELLLLLRWICENDPETITKMVSKAWKKGFKEELMKINSENFSQIDLQEAAFDFFAIMESCVSKYSENSTKKILNLISEKIDPDVLTSLKINDEDSEALINAFGKTKELFLEKKNYLKDSIEHSSSKENFAENQKINSNKDLFLQEFLNNWEPKDKILN